MNDLTKYESIRKEIRTGDLIEWQSKSPLGYAIRWFTKRDVNHTSGVVSMRVDGVLATRKYILEADSAGFHPAFLSARLANFKGHVCYLKLKRSSNEDRIKFFDKVLELDGRPYDYTSLFRNAYRRVKLGDDTVFCSEAYHLALKRCGWLPCDYSPTGKDKHKGTAMRPGEFGMTGLFNDPVWIL